MWSRMPRSRKAVIIMAVAILNLLLLMSFNTMLWPYLWPRPLIYIVGVAIFVALWFPELFKGIWAMRIIGAMMIFVGQSYMLHSIIVFFAAPSFISLIHAIGTTGTLATLTVNYINQLAPRNNKTAPPLPKRAPYVAVIVPTCGEPLDVLENTVASLAKMKYPRDKFFLLVTDDSKRESVRDIALKYGGHYNQGPGDRKLAKAGNLNSALDYLDLHFPRCELVLTQDADEIIHPDFLLKVVGYFNDPQVGLVQTPKEAVSPKWDPFGVRDRVFYDIIQPGRNGANAAFACGSGVVWRLAAIRNLPDAGFDTWNIVEDLTTSYKVHCAGWKTEYHNEILTAGLAPDDIRNLIKQRGTWATDNWRLFLFFRPFAEKRLSVRQRLQYTELGLFYINTSFFLPMIMLTPLLSLLTGVFVPIAGAALFPWLVLSMLYYVALTEGNRHFMLIMLRYWVAHFWTNITAFRRAIKSRKGKEPYKVTAKSRTAGFYGSLVWPQFIYCILGIVATINGIFGLPDINWQSKLANLGVLWFFMYMTSAICIAAFHGVDWPAQFAEWASVWRKRFGALVPRLPRVGRRTGQQFGAGD